MAAKRKIYRAICELIIEICDLFPGFNIAKFIKEEELKLSNAPSLLFALRAYKEKLELDNDVITSDEETEEIMREGIRIHSILIKEQMYGED